MLAEIQRCLRAPTKATMCSDPWHPIKSTAPRLYYLYEVVIRLGGESAVRDDGLELTSWSLRVSVVFY